MTTTKTARPPMGWNSWDCYGTTIAETELLANARFMAEHLLPYGWDTLVVDADWSDPDARAHGYNDEAALVMDEYGRLLPDPVRFPSAAAGGGFRPLADEVHALGLKFGIHVMRGIPRRAVAANTSILGTDAHAVDVADERNRCGWNPHLFGLNQTHPAAQAYYDSTVALYASWGVDFVKADDMLWPYQAAEIEAYASAVERCGRDIVLSLSPGGPSFVHLDHLREHATMFRICNDVWDRWEDVEANFVRFARWASHAGPAGWPDGDMLPLGRIGLRSEVGDPRDDRFTPDERVTLMTLWVIARSPLMIGGDLPSSDPATIALFRNADVLAVHAGSSNAREVFREEPLVLWASDGPGGERYAAAFNLGTTPLTVALDAGDLGMPARLDGGELRELWTRTAPHTRPVTVQSDEAHGVTPGNTAIDLTLAPHGAALLRWAP
jgi:hypothetical protein